MGLGNLLNIADYEPKRRETSSKLLTVDPQQESKKTERLELRISSDLLLLFKDICEENKTDASKALRAYIVDVVSSGSMELYVQNVRTTGNSPIYKVSRGFSAFGELNLRNEEERKEWLKNFRNWGVWLSRLSSSEILLKAPYSTPIKRKAKSYLKPPGSNCPTTLIALTSILLYAKQSHLSIGRKKII